MLADGAFVLTTYGHWEPGESPFIRTIHLHLAELDALADGPAPDFARVAGTVRPTPRLEGWWERRFASDLQQAKKGEHELLFVGDSITQGWGGSGKAVWQELFVPRNAINLGASGDRTQNVLWRLDNGLTDALAETARAVVVMIGTNNATHGEATPAEIAAGVEAVVQRLLDGLPNARVLLIGIFPARRRDAGEALPGRERDARGALRRPRPRRLIATSANTS